MTRSLPFSSSIPTQSPAGEKGAVLWVKRGIYAYFWLLIIEGALRKWILPQLSGPLLIVRDPIVIFIYWQAYRSGRLKSHDFLPVAAVAICVAFLSAAQIAMGINDFLTALFGFRSYFLHLPLIFVMKQILTPEDVKKIGRWTLLIVLPMALLMQAQFRQDAGGWLNKGIGDHAMDGQLEFTDGHVRASGTFSFVSGISDFFPFVAAFLLFAVADAPYSKIIVGLAAVGNILAIPAAGSRTLVVSTLVVVACAILTNLKNVRSFMRLSKTGVVLVFAGLIASQTPIFRDSVTAMTERWNSANQEEGQETGLQGALASRVLTPLLSPFQNNSDFTWFGQGIGAGSNVASALKYDGERNFLLAEDEWPRVFQEFGLFFGALFMGFRVYLCVALISAGYRSYQAGSSLSLLIAAAVVPLLATGVMEQATNLGFIAFGTGLSFAAAVPRGARKSVVTFAPNRQIGQSGRVTL